MIAPPPPALVETAIAFRPPVGVPLRYETHIERQGARGPVTMHAIYEVRFARDGAGWRMESVLVEHGASGSAAAATLMEAGMRPMQGVPVTLALGRDGAPGGLIGAEAAWAGVLAGHRATRAWLAAQPRLAAPLRSAVEGLLARSEALDAAGRAALLAEGPAELVAFAGGTLAGTRIEAGGLAGTARLLRADATRVTYALDLAGDGVERRDTIDVDRATGLVARSVSRRTIGGADAITRTTTAIVPR